MFLLVIQNYKLFFLDKSSAPSAKNLLIFVEPQSKNPADAPASSKSRNHRSSSNLEIPNALAVISNVNLVTLKRSAGGNKISAKELKVELEKRVKESRKSLVAVPICPLIYFRGKRRGKLPANWKHKKFMIRTGPPRSPPPLDPLVAD